VVTAKWTLAALLGLGVAGPAFAAPDCAARLLAPAGTAPAKALTARSLVELRDFGGSGAHAGAPSPFSISPDGHAAALILRRADPDSDLYCHGVVIVPLTGEGRPRLVDVGGDYIPLVYDLRGITGVTGGAPAMIVPVWSPDGRSLAFLRRERGTAQAWIVAAVGGAARQVTHFPTDVTAIRWSADGRLLGATTRPGLAAAAASIAAEGRGGYQYDRRFMPLMSARPLPPASLPPAETWIDAATGVVAAAPPNRDAARPKGAILFARSSTGAQAWTAPDDPQAFVPATPLHVSLQGVALACPTAACDGHVAGLWWVDPNVLLFVRAGYPANGGRDELYRWDVRKRGPVRILSTADALIGCQWAQVGLICAREASTAPRTLVAIDPVTGQSRLLFDPNPDFPAATLGQVRRLTWTDGRGVTTYGDLVLPPGRKQSERVPLVVVQYTSRGFLRGGTGDEYPIFLLAAHGIAVLSVQRPASLPAADAALNLTDYQRVNIKNFAERRMIVGALEAGVDAAVATGMIDPDSASERLQRRTTASASGSGLANSRSIAAVSRGSRSARTPSSSIVRTRSRLASNSRAEKLSNVPLLRRAITDAGRRPA
jgi:hypothetical protein